MCVVSMVMDQFGPLFPMYPKKWTPPSTWPAGAPIEFPGHAPRRPVISELEMKQLIDAFHKAYEAAKTADKITGQPDCEDPEKVKLLERVEQLEKRLAELEAKGND